MKAMRVGNKSSRLFAMAKSIVSDLRQIFKISVSAVLPENLIRRSIQYNPNNQHLTIAGENYNLLNKNIHVVGTGKAVKCMAEEVERILAPNIKKGIISIPEGTLLNNNKGGNVIYCEGAKNNLPDKNAENTSKFIKELVTKLDKDDVLLVLISGGGSALLPLPKDPITLEEKTHVIKKLANSGADIKELNTVRKKLSDIKGGQLAIKAQPATVVALILSDIVGDPLDLIASGPTTADTDDPSKALSIIDKYIKSDDIPESVKLVLNSNNKIIKFPQDNVKNLIIGSNKICIEAAVEHAKKLKYLPIELSHVVTGNVKEIAFEYTKLVKALCMFLDGTIDKDNLKTQINDLNIPGLNTDFINIINSNDNKDLCLIFGGEITVEVKGNGKGGRSQQLALEFSNFIHSFKTELKNYDIYLLSAGTDGIDGPTDAAGAIGHLNLISDSIDENIDVSDYLENNDSYNFYRDFKNGDLHIITGHTNTNVMDLHLLLIKRMN